MNKSVGEILKAARLGRQITLEQASFATRIRQRFLEALEKDLAELIPSETQARGFLRLYADFLEIPYQPLLETWDGDGKRNENSFDSTLSDLAPSSAKQAFEQQSKSLKAADALEQNPIQDKHTSQQLFEEIGSDISKQRLKLGLSLQDIEEHTHVRQHYLSLIETGKLENLPSFVQARGLLNNYISFLQMDIDRIMVRFAEALQARRIEIATPKQNRTKPNVNEVSTSPMKRLLNPDMVIGSMVVLILFIFVIWGASKISSLREFQSSGPSDISGFDLGTITPIILPMNSLSPEINTPIALQNNDINKIVGEEQVEPQENTDPIQLYIVANQRAYLKITADDKIAFNGRTVPGSAYSFSALDQIELITGNSAALQVFYNQKDIGTIGLVGQPGGIIFTVRGYLTPTPQFTATATNTPQPTSTIPASPTQTTSTITPYIP